MSTRPVRRPLAAPDTSTPAWRWAWLGAAFGALATLVVWAPARWLADGLAYATRDRLQLLNARGTVWNGTAQLVLSNGSDGAERTALPGPLAWSLRPGLGAVSGRIDIECCAQQPLGFRAMPRAGGMQLDWQDARSRWPAQMLSGLGAPWNSLRPEGTLDLSTQGLSLRWGGGQLALAGRAVLDATDISSRLSTLRPMGSYRVAIEGGSRPSLLLTTREGSLQLNGSGLWNGRALRFSGEASAAPGREDALSNLLNIIGRRDGARSLITLG